LNAMPGHRWSFAYFPGWWLLRHKFRQTIARVIGRVEGYGKPSEGRCPLCGMTTREFAYALIDPAALPAGSRTCRNPLCYTFDPF